MTATTMAIGGVDWVLRGQTSEKDRSIVLAGVLRVWPSAVVQGAQDGPRPLAGSLDLDRVGEEDELFVYRDQAAYEDWEVHGATQANGATMIHVLIGRESLTLVADAVDSEAGYLCSGLRSAIEASRALPTEARRPARRS